MKRFLLLLMIFNIKVLIAQEGKLIDPVSKHLLIKYFLLDDTRNHNDNSIVITVEKEKDKVVLHTVTNEYCEKYTSHLLKKQSTNQKHNDRTLCKETIYYVQHTSYMQQKVTTADGFIARTSFSLEEFGVLKETITTVIKNLEEDPISKLLIMNYLEMQQKEKRNDDNISISLKKESGTTDTIFLETQLTDKCNNKILVDNLRKLHREKKESKLTTYEIMETAIIGFKKTTIKLDFDFKAKTVFKDYMFKEYCDVIKAKEFI